MKSLNQSNSRMHQEVVLLLPWYVNGTLQVAERQRVDMHLKQCTKCRYELKQIQKLATWVKDSDPVDTKANGHFNDLMTRIQESEVMIQQPQQQAKKVINLKSRISKTLKYVAASRYSYIAQAAIVLLAIGVLINPIVFKPEVELNQFRTLSSSRMNPSGNSEYRVIFTQNYPESKVLQVISSISGEIISGPDAHNIYILRFDDDKIEQSGISDRIATLRKNNDVIFVEPATSVYLSGNNR